MMYYLAPNHHGASQRVYRIDGTHELVDFAMRDDLGDQTMTGDEYLKRRLGFLTGVVANLIDRVAPDDQDKLDLLGLYAYTLTTDPDEA